MKKIFLLVVLGFGINILGLGQSLLVDDFTGYTIGNLGGQGSWTKGGSGPDATVANTTALTYPNYNGGGAEYVSMPSASSTTSREYKGYTTTTVSTGTFYISFLLKLSSTTATGDYFISLGDAAGGTNYYFKLYAKTSGSGYLLGISSQAAIGSAAFGATVLSLNTTYLVLLRLTGVTGSTNDLLYLWVNPTISSEPNTSSAYASKTSDADPTSLGQFIWHNRSANNPSGSFDGIRVAYGTTSANAWTNLNAYSSGGALTPPTLIAASGATVDSPFDVTFTDDPIWRAAITSITVGGTTLTVGYNTTNAGKITFTPSASSPAALLQSSGTKTIVVIATGYSNATVSQTIGVGAANKLGMKTQPTAPASNGAALATQPEVYIQDQYGNVTTNTATVVAAVGAGTWTIGGTTSKAGASGTATYTDLTATSPAAVTGATISFTSSGLTGVTSSTFNIPAPAPANDLCAGAQVIPASGPFPYLTTTVDNTNATATGDPTPSCQSFFGHSIWYTFTPSVSGGFTFSTCSSETATTISDDVMSLYSGSCGSLTPLSCNDNGGPSCTGALASINATLTSGTTYYMMVAGYSNNVGNIQIRVSCQPAVLTTTAASSVAQTSAQSGGNITNDGGFNITSRGVCWSTSSNPTTSDTKTTDGSGTGPYTSSISGLSDNTTYHVRAYAVNSNGTYYGNDVNFTTTNISAPTATAATTVTSTSFVANWSIVTGATGYRLDVSTSPTFLTASNATDLFISEYIEGSSNNKYIEIYNGTGVSIDLSNYKLRAYNNGASISPTYDVALSGTLNNNSTIVYKNSSATIYSGSATNNDVCQFNGNDAITLYKVSTASNVDIFGRIGENPGPAWISGSFSTLDKTLVRKSSITGGVTTNPSSGFPTLSTEWNQFNVDDASHLGSHDYGIPSFIPGYDNKDVSTNLSWTITGLTTGTTYYYRVRAIGVNSTSPNSNVISATPFLKQSITAADWNTASTWDPSGVPTGTEDILVKHAVTLSGAPEGVSNNVTINSGASVTINSGGALTVNGTLSNANTSGIVIKNGGSLKYASGTPSGTAERSVSNGTYHYLSSPVTSTTFNSVFPINQDKIWAQTYKESDGTWNNQTYATTLTPGVGYSIWVDATLSPQTANFSGVFNNDGVQFTLSKVNPGNDANLVGWNFLGNPYTAAIDWDNGGWHGGAGINGSVYTWNGSNYISWSGSTGSLTGGVIPAQNGFFVKTTVNGTVMTIPWSARVHSSQSLYKDAPANTLHLNIAGNNYKDDTYVQFVPGTTSGFDSQGDAYKLPGINEAPQLYSIIPGDVLSINALPSIPTNNEVSLGMKVGANTTYTITADGMETFDNSVPIYMDDLKLGVSTYLRNTPVYTFTAAPGDDENRFRLRFHYPTGVNEQQEAVNIFVYAAHGEIVLNNAGNYDGKFYVYSTTGQLLATGQMQGGKQTISSMPAGMYIVKAVTGNTIVSRKVILY